MSKRPEEPTDPSPLADPSPVPPARTAAVVVPRWVQLVVLPLCLLGMWALARAAGPVLLVFMVAAVIALILNPVVKFLQRPLRRGRFRLPRGLAVFAVYIGFFAALVGVGLLLANPVSNQVERLQKDIPHLVRSANHSLANFQRYLDRKHINIHIKKQGESALSTLQKNVLKGSGNLVKFSRDLLQKLVEAAFALILVLVISVYMLLYADRIGGVVRGVMPPGDGSPDDDYPLRIQKGVSSYVRGQAIFSLIMGSSVAIAMWILGAVGIFPDGQRYALVFGAFYGLMEAIPYLGPILGAIPPILVALFNDPLTAVWVALTFLALQQLEGHVVAPQVFGHSLRINPLLVIFALLIGFELYGIIGALLALPLAAMARETVIYLRRHLVLEPWGTMSPLEVAAVKSLPAGSARSCPDCGASASTDDAFCRSCGAPLRPPVATPS